MAHWLSLWGGGLRAGMSFKICQTKDVKEKETITDATQQIEEYYSHSSRYAGELTQSM
jgi:hypothetical protein